eukprot:546568-Karenia_brevis.AAC.1
MVEAVASMSCWAGDSLLEDAEVLGQRMRTLIAHALSSQSRCLTSQAKLMYMPFLGAEEFAITCTRLHMLD